jgi:hypothetical protein
MVLRCAEHCSRGVKPLTVDIHHSHHHHYITTTGDTSYANVSFTDPSPVILATFKSSTNCIIDAIVL